MSSQALKLNIHDLVNKTEDEEVLQGIYLLLKKFIANNDDHFTEFETDGTSFSDLEFVNSILDADTEIEKGNFIANSDMKVKFGYQKSNVK
jgi:hypothetical protein